MFLLCVLCVLQSHALLSSEVGHQAPMSWQLLVSDSQHACSLSRHDDGQDAYSKSTHQKNPHALFKIQFLQNGGFYEFMVFGDGPYSF